MVYDRSPVAGAILYPKMFDTGNPSPVLNLGMTGVTWRCHAEGDPVWHIHYIIFKYQLYTIKDHTGETSNN